MAPRLDPAVIEGLQHRDPKVYQYLKDISFIVDDIQNKLDPLVAQSVASAISNIVPADIIGFFYTLQSNGVKFDWTASANASEYELRIGVSFDLGIQVTITPSNTVIIPPIVVGVSTYWIKARSSSGLESLATRLIVTVPPIGVIPITSRVIDNNILLNWTPPSSTFTIDHYNLYKNNNLIGISTGTFTTLFEAIAGIYIYSLEAVDIAGNISDRNPVTLSVTAPPDYILQDSRVSMLLGARVNAYRDAARPQLFVCVDTCGV